MFDISVPRPTLPVMLEKTKFLLDGGRIKASVYEVAGWDFAISHDELARLLKERHAKLPRFVGTSLADVEREIKKRSYLLTHRLFDYGTPKRIYKMLKREHLDAFLKDGTIGLGPISYYRTAADPIVDHDEGQFVLFGIGDRTTIFCVCGLGTNIFAYCTTTNHKVRFAGYDACLQIRHVNGFGRAVTRALNEHLKAHGNRVLRSLWAPCHYQYSRVVGGKLEGSNDNIQAHVSSLFVDIVGEGKFFIKPNPFSHESEYRLIWVLEQSVEDYLVFKCPEAIKYCRPFA
jgi:hypothetical protein